MPKSNEFVLYLADEEVADRLNAAMALKGRARLTAQDIVDWVGDDSGAAGKNYNKTNAVVERYFGTEMYRAIESTARTIGVLHARLQGFDKAVIGGYKFQNLQDGLK